MTDTRSRRQRHISTEPLHVVEGPDGVVVFFPDGRSMALTVDAAVRSTLLMARAVRRANARTSAAGETAPRQSGAIIPVDFTAGSRVHQARS